MGNRLSNNRAFVVIFAAAIVVHLLMLLVPVVRQQEPVPDRSPTVTVRLKQAAPEQAEPEPVPIEAPRLEPVEPVELAELPAPEPQPVESSPTETPRITAHRILSDLQEKQQADPLAAPSWEREAERPDYYARYQPALEEVLNEPSLQLPFEDTRIYLVDSYDPGFIGGVQKFFDDVTVPFGFTTKHNTRVQCVWLLVVAGCGWGPLKYHDPAAKPPTRNPSTLN